MEEKKMIVPISYINALLDIISNGINKKHTLAEIMNISSKADSFPAYEEPKTDEPINNN